MNVPRSRDAVRPGDGFDIWHRVTCREFSLTECQRIVDNEFRAGVSVRQFGPLMINEIWSSTYGRDRIKVIRSSQDIRKDPRDYFMLWLTIGGEAVFSQNGRDARMEADSLVLHDQAQPFSLEFGERSRSVMISVPRPLLMSRVQRAHELTALRIERQSKLGPFVGSVIRELTELNGELNEDAVRSIGMSALDMFATAIEIELVRAGESRLDRGRLEHVKRFIVSNLGDPSLSLTTISIAQNISPRTLIRLFAREGTTPIRWLWQQRLVASYRALAEGQVRRVTDAALTFGFNDLSHFSRSFKAAFGRSPQSLKNKTRRL